MEVGKDGYRKFSFSPGINGSENSCHAVPYDPNLPPPSARLYEERQMGCEMIPFNSQRPVGVSYIGTPRQYAKPYWALGRPGFSRR